MDIEGTFYCSRCIRQIREETVCPHCGYDHRREYNKSPSLETGTLLKGRYQLGSVIGIGGFGITYAAWDETLQAAVAVKEFFPEEYVSRDAEYSDQVIVKEKYRRQYLTGMDHFLREARVLSMLSEMPGTVSAHDYFEENGTAYIVMEYLRGKTLADSVREREFSGKELLTMFREVIDALAALHRQGILHRDITPSNLMVMPDGSMKLIDFGSAAKMVREQSMVVATKRYAPIEQYTSEGTRLGAWTDIYGLCATMYEVLTDTPLQEALARLQKDETVPIEKKKVKIRRYQARAIMDGLAIEPEKRIQSMEEFRSRLYNLPLPEEIKKRRQFMHRAAGISGAGILLTVLCAFNFSTGLPLGNHVLFSLQGDGFHVYDSFGTVEKLELPETKWGIPVVAVEENAFENVRTLQSAVIPGSVKKIGAMAFFGCSSLEEVKLKDGVEVLGEYAFAGCPALRTMWVPESLLYLNEKMFDGDSEFLTLWGEKDGRAEDMAESAGLVFSSRTDYEVVDNGEGTVALTDCREEGPDLVLPSVIDGKKVTEIWKESGPVFAYEQFDSIRFPEYLEIMPEYLFFNAYGEKEQKVTKVTLPPNLKSTGRAAFMESGLAEAELPDGLETIDDSSFGWTELSEISIPDTVKKIGKNSFSSTKLKKVELPEALEEIEGQAFSNCDQLTEILLPEKLETIPAALFMGCRSLEEILLPESVKEIGPAAFQSCYALEHFEIPPNVTEIQTETFSGCIHLKYIYIPESVTAISPDAFVKCSRSLVIGGKRGSEAERFAREQGFSFETEELLEKNIMIPESGTVYLTEQSGTDVILPTYDKENHTLVKTVGSVGLPDGLRSVKLPAWAETIEERTFSNQRYEGKSEKLESVTLPESLVRIGDCAFMDCKSLRSIDLPENLLAIENGAFFGCSSLKEIRIPASLEFLRQQAFEGCRNLEDVYVYAELASLDTNKIGGAFTICPKLTIHGYQNSAIETYAENCGIPFKILE